MSYEQKNDTALVQQYPNLLQNLAQIPLKAWALLIVSGVVVFGGMAWYTGLAITICGYAIIVAMEREQALKEAKARAATYANCIGPVIVSSIHPNETIQELHERADDWRQQLILSGNPYAEKIPIIEFPYNVMLSDYGQLSAGWSTYQRDVGQTQHMENLKWYEGKCPNELKGLFASAVLPAPKHTEI